MRKESVTLAYIPSNSLTLRLEEKTVNTFVFTEAECISAFSSSQEGQAFLKAISNRKSVSYHAEQEGGPFLDGEVSNKRGESNVIYFTFPSDGSSRQLQQLL